MSCRNKMAKAQTKKAWLIRTHCGSHHLFRRKPRTPHQSVTEGVNWPKSICWRLLEDLGFKELPSCSGPYRVTITLEPTDVDTVRT